MVDNKHIPFGFDESASCDPLCVAGFIEPQMSKIAKNMTNGHGSILDGAPFNGRLHSGPL